MNARTCIRRSTVTAIALAALLAGCAPRHGPNDRVLRHVVEDGESLEDVAADFYGSTRRAREIRRFNDIDRGEEPAAGRELRIPMTPDDMVFLERRRRARVPYNAGLELVAKGSYLDASTRFREAVELDPDFAAAHYNLGTTYQRMKAGEKAHEQFEKAVDLRPDNADYHFALGGSCFHLERYRRAAREFRRALDIDPFHLQARFSYAATLEKLGRLDDARREWRRYLELDDSSAWADKARTRLEALDGP